MGKSKKKETVSVGRRNFIKGLGTGALGTAVIPPLLGQETITTKKGAVPVFDKKGIHIEVNGKSLALVVEPNEILLDVLRDRLDLVGTKKVCNRGECGACTILLDGEPVYSCMFPAIRADGKKITTVEGLASGEKLHPVQEAFVEKDAYQCGFCTPGFLMTSAAFLAKNPSPSTEDIKHSLSGNLCRCGNYAKIYDAVDSAAAKMRRG